MTWMETIRNAGSGWSGILASREDWPRQFALDADGLNRGFIAYGVAVLFAIVLGSVSFGLPAPGVMGFAVIGHLIPALALVGATVGARRMLDLDVSIVNFLVPGLYMLALVKIIEGLSAVIGIPLAGAILAIIGFMSFKLARANGLGIPPATGYGVVMFLLVAGLTVGLYMLVGRIG